MSCSRIRWRIGGATAVALLIVALGVHRHGAGRMPDVAAVAAVPPEVQAFDRWLQRWRVDPAGVDPAVGLELATARRALLVRWIATDPQRVLAHAIGPADHRRLPPPIRAQVEEPVRGRGALECQVACSFAADDRLHRHEVVHRIRLGTRSWRVRLPAAIGPRTELPVAGVALDDHLALEPAALSVVPTPRAAGKRAHSNGGKRLLVVRCRPAGAPAWSDPPERATLEAQLAETSAWYRAASWGQTWFEPEIGLTPVVDLPESADYYKDHFHWLRQHAYQAALAVGFDYRDYDRVVAMSNVKTIKSSGLAYVTDRFFVVGDNQLSGGTAVHEIGHTYGLRHANLWRSSDGNPRSRDGDSVEYGDWDDAMADRASRPFNLWYRHVLDWTSVEDGSLRWTTGGGTFRIYNQLERRRLDGATYGLAVLMSAAESGSEPRLHGGEFLVIGYRHNEAFAGQAVVHASSTPFSGDLQQHRLDLTPGTASLEDAGLPLGSSLVDADNARGGVRITPVATGTSTVAGVAHEWLEVAVALGPGALDPGTDPPAGSERRIRLEALPAGWVWTGDTGIDPVVQGDGATLFGSLDPTTAYRFAPAPAGID